MKQIKLAITGDLSITGSFEEKVINNEEIFSDEIINILNDVDYCICNLEGVITSYSIHYTKLYDLNYKYNNQHHLEY